MPTGRRLPAGWQARRIGEQLAFVTREPGTDIHASERAGHHLYGQGWRDEGPGFFAFSYSGSRLAERQVTMDARLLARRPSSSSFGGCSQAGMRDRRPGLNQVDIEQPLALHARCHDSRPTLGECGRCQAKVRTVHGSVLRRPGHTAAEITAARQPSGPRSCVDLTP